MKEQNTAERKARIDATTLIHGDCREALKDIPSGSVDAVIAVPADPDTMAQVAEIMERRGAMRVQQCLHDDRGRLFRYEVHKIALIDEAGRHAETGVRANATVSVALQGIVTREKKPIAPAVLSDQLVGFAEGGAEIRVRRYVNLGIAAAIVAGGVLGAAVGHHDAFTGDDETPDIVRPDAGGFEAGAVRPKARHAAHVEGGRVIFARPLYSAAAMAKPKSG